MNTVKLHIFVATLLAFVFGLIGCSDSGGHHGGRDTSLISITSSNALQVAGTTFRATEFLARFEAESIFAPTASLTGGTTTYTPGFTLTNFISSQLKHLLTIVPQANTGVFSAVAIEPTTFDCQISGTMTISGSVADPTFNTMTPGDFITAAFNNCDDDEGVVLSGSFTFTVQAFTGNLVTLPYSVTALVNFANLAGTEAGQTVTLNGKLTYVESTTDGVVYTDKLSGELLSFSDSTGDKGKWTNFTDTTTADFNNLGYAVDGSGTLETDDLGGSVQYKTTTTIQGIGANDPFAGVMLVTGANNSSVTITAVNSTDVTIEVDEDGDGVTDQTINTTWDALRESSSI